MVLIFRSLDNKIRFFSTKKASADQLLANLLLLTQFYVYAAVALYNHLVALRL
jgi:hypothetical protein